MNRHADKSIDWESNDNWTSYADAGFSTTIDPADMLLEKTCDRAPPSGTCC